MKSKAIISRDFSLLVFIDAKPIIANNSPKNWPNNFATSLKLEMELILLLLVITHIYYIYLIPKKNLIRKTECYLVEVETKPVEFVAAAPSAIVPLTMSFNVAIRRMKSYEFEEL
jgi:hypothetical protein